MLPLHPEFARVLAAHSLIDDARLLSWARVRYFGPHPGPAPEYPEVPLGLKAEISDTGVPIWIAFDRQVRPRAGARRQRARESWGDSEWMRRLLADYLFGCCESRYTGDDVKAVLTQGQDYAQAIADAFSQ